MPKSKVRKKNKSVDPAFIAASTQAPHEAPESPAWLVPVMLSAFIAGLIWIVIYYVSGTKGPVSSFHAWNMAVGFGFIAVGFSLATKWR